MKRRQSWLVAVSCILWCVFAVNNADRNQNRTYIDLTQPIPCVRRFNATHQIGCGGVQTGLMYAVRNQIELSRLLTDRITPDVLGSRRLVVVANAQWFPQLVDWALNASSTASSILAGLVLVEQANVTLASGYSDDVSSPNAEFSIYANKSNWNTPGRGAMFVDFKYPVYIITNQDEADQTFLKCYMPFNRIVFERTPIKIHSTDLLCGIQLGMDMSGAVSSRVCVRRSNIIHTLDYNYFCDPLGGSSYFTPLALPTAPNPASVATNNLILSARIDTFTLFESYTPGANEPISALVGLMVLADLLATVRLDFDRMSPVFVLFDNEAFDYGGSSRFVRDLLAGQMPLVDLLDGKSINMDKSQLAAMLELNQLGAIGLNDNNKLYAHKDPVSYKANSTVANLIDKINEQLKNFSNEGISPITTTGAQIPPSSSQTFLRYNISLAALAITGFETTYSNAFFHSVFDTPLSLDIRIPDNLPEPDVYKFTTRFARRLEPLVLAIAQTVYSLGSSKTAPFQPPAGNYTLELINKLVYCFYKNNTCDYIKSIFSDSQWTTYKKLLENDSPPNRLSFYTSVNDNLMSGKFLSLQLLRYFTRFRELETLNATECVKDSPAIKSFQTKYANVTIKGLVYVKGNSPKCVASIVRLTSAISPAFDRIDDGLLVNTDKYAAWTESSWNSVSVHMRMFMFSQPAVEGLTLALGIVVTIVAIVLTFVFNRYADRWFLLKNPEQAAEFIQ